MSRNGGCSRQLTSHRSVESVRHISDVALSKGTLMRIDCEGEIVLTLIRIGIRGSRCSQQTQSNRLALDCPSVLAFTEQSASVSEVIGHCRSGTHRHSSNIHARGLRNLQSANLCAQTSNLAISQVVFRVVARCRVPKATSYVAMSLWISTGNSTKGRWTSAS